MLPQLKTYIENNIEYLDEKNYYFFILNSISEDLSDAEIRDLIEILYDVEDNRELIDTARDNILRSYITMEVEVYADDDAAKDICRIPRFVSSYLYTYLGYNYKEVIDFILENKSEWVDNMIEKNGEWMFCK